MIIFFYILTGLFTGTLAGFFGIGGGIVLIPILVYFFGLTQHQAHGTSLAVMIPPITLFAAVRYYQNGNVKLIMVPFIALGFIVGGVLGADIANKISDILLRRIFGITLLFISLRIILFK